MDVGGDLRLKTVEDRIVFGDVRAIIAQEIIVRRRRTSCNEKHRRMTIEEDRAEPKFRIDIDSPAVCGVGEIKYTIGFIVSRSMKLDSLFHRNLFKRETLTHRKRKTNNLLVEILWTDVDS